MIIIYVRFKYGINQNFIFINQDTIMEKQTQDLKAIFNSFDKNKSGSIEMNEVKAIAAKHGYNVSPEQLAEMFGEIDINGDGKISFDEFALCWNYGIVGKMKNLVVMQGKAMQLGSFCSQFLRSSSVDHKIESPKESYTYEEVYTTKDPQFSFSINVNVKGQKLQSKLDNLVQTVPGFDPKGTNLILSLTCPKPSEVKAIIQQMVQQEVDKGLPIDQLAKYKLEVGSNSTLNIIISTTEISQNMFKMSMGRLQQTLQMFGKEFFFNGEGKFDIAGSYAQMQKCKTKLDAFLLGYKLSVNLQTTLNGVQMMKQLSNQPEQIVKKYFSQSHVVKNVMNSPEDLKKFFKQKGHGQYFMNSSANIPNLKFQKNNIDKRQENFRQILRKLFSGQLFRLDAHATTPLYAGSFSVTIKQPKQFAKDVKLI